MATPNQLPQPIERHPDRLIENIYPQTFLQSDAPDRLSARVAEQYLIDRFQSPLNDGRPPQVVLEPVEKKGLGRADGWRWLAGLDYTRTLRWREIKHTRSIKIMGASIVASLLANGIYNRDWISDHIWDRHEKSEISGRPNNPNPYKVTLEKLPVTIPSLPVTEKAEYHSPSGQPEYKPTLAHFVKEMDNLRNSGVMLDAIHLYASASDEYLAKLDGSFETKDPENRRLALERAEAIKQDLKQKAQELGIALPTIEIHAAESVLNHRLHGLMERTARQFGYSNLARAIEFFNQDPDKMSPTMRHLLQTHIGDKRGVSLSVSAHTEAKSFDIIVPKITQTEQPNPPSTSRDKDGWEIFPCFIPAIPLPRLRIVPKTKYKEKIIPGIEPDDEWMKIYEEALLPDGKTLRPDTWAYTRKYQALLRDERIKQVFEAGYNDADGKQQKLRILFVDHEPTLETLAAFEKLLQSFSLARRGKMANFLNAIAVFPQENAGLDVESPKQIGLGVDRQLEASTLGLAFPGIGLTEMHMPTKPTAEQLNEFFVGGRWIFAHEVDGHFTHLNGKPPQAERIRTHMPRSYVLNDQWSNAGEDHYRQLASEELNHPRLWRIRRGMQTITGQIIRREGDIADNDPRLHEARRIQVENRFPTEYSASSHGELYAEGMAQALTGIEIPFSQQPDLIDPPTDPSFATGYHIGSRLLNLIRINVGSSPYVDGIKWPRNVVEVRKAEWEADQGTVEVSPQLVRLNIEGRQWAFRHPEDARILNILVRGRSIATQGLQRSIEAARAKIT